MPGVTFILSTGARSNMNVSLSAELKNFVNDRVKNGSFKSPSDVIAKALRVLQEHEAEIERLRKEIDIGIEQADRGECVPLDMQEIKSHARALWKKRKKA